MQEQDHLTRGAMCALMRQGWSQGEALTHAIKEHAIEWKISTIRVPQLMVGEKEIHMKRSKGVSKGGRDRPWDDRSRPRGVRDRDRPRDGDRRRLDRVKRDRFDKRPDPPKHCTHYKGKEICKGFNDGRCTAWSGKECPNKRLHVCDVRLPNGLACGGNHPRSKHKWQ